MFSYDQGEPLDIKTLSVEHRGTVAVSDITYAAPGSDRRIAAYLLTPSGDGPHAGILYIHWYEPPNPTSNRTQFVDEAVRLAELGVVSLLPETLWSRDEWFGERSRDDDYAATIRQTIDLRRAIDVLLAQPNIDPARIALVGHDFGGMFGAVLANVDRRPQHYVIMAATPRFADWYLYGPPMEEEARQRFVDQLRPLDPTTNIREAKGPSYLFQFGTRDAHVPRPRGIAFYNVTPEPKQIRWYDAEHNLDVADAHRDRVEWLTSQLKLTLKPADVATPA
jgi:dienelactone hydrolase